MSAWDIERENPLYLPQSKIYDGCCALGPVLLTPAEVPDPSALEMRMRIHRGPAVIFEGRISTSRMRRSLEELIAYLLRSNTIPLPTVLLTGTGIIAPQESALRPGDVVEIELVELCTLRNPVAEA